MQAIVRRGLGNIRQETVPDPKIEQPTDAVICGTDLRSVRGTF